MFFSTASKEVFSALKDTFAVWLSSFQSTLESAEFPDFSIVFLHIPQLPLILTVCVVMAVFCAWLYRLLDKRKIAMIFLSTFICFSFLKNIYGFLRNAIGLLDRHGQVLNSFLPMGDLFLMKLHFLFKLFWVVPKGRNSPLKDRRATNHDIIFLRLKRKFLAAEREG